MRFLNKNEKKNKNSIRRRWISRANIHYNGRIQWQNVIDFHFDSSRMAKYSVSSSLFLFLFFFFVFFLFVC